MSDLIDRQAAIDAVIKRDANCGIDSAEVLKALPSAQPEQRWVPVTEHTLPNHNSVVVVCGEKGTWDFGTYRGHTQNHINFWNWKKNTIKEVHWWMYKEDALPMPWKGEDDG